MEIHKTPNKTLLILNDTERTFLLVIAEDWLLDRPGVLDQRSVMASFALDLAKELAP